MLTDKGISSEACCFSSFQHHILKEIKRLDSSFRCGYLYEYYDEMDPVYYSQNGDSCNISYTHLTKELVDSCHRAGTKVCVYFPSIFRENPSVYPRILEMGVDGIISDMPLEFLSYIKTLV